MVKAGLDLWVSGQPSASLGQSEVFTALLHTAVRIGGKIAQVHLVDDGVLGWKIRPRSDGSVIGHDDGAPVASRHTFAIRIGQLTIGVKAGILASSRIGVVAVIKIAFDLAFPGAVSVTLEIDGALFASNRAGIEIELECAGRGRKDPKGSGLRRIDCAQRLIGIVLIGWMRGLGGLCRNHRFSSASNCRWNGLLCNPVRASIG